MAKILAIDDEQNCLEVIKFALSSRGFDIITAENGEEAMKYLLDVEHSPIDLILLDMMMPEICGIKTLELIRSNKNLDNIPIIVQTGTSDHGEIKNSLRMSGIQYIIRKPYNREELVDLINLVLQSRLKP